MTQEIYKKYNKPNQHHNKRLVKITFNNGDYSIKVISMTGREFSIYTRINKRLFEYSSATMGCTIEVSSMPFPNDTIAFEAYYNGDVEFV